MKLLLDQGLPRSAAGLLCQAGLDTVHTGEIGLATAGDEQILDLARDSGRVVVTLDADFHTLLALSGATSPSVIRIRIEGLDAGRLADLVNTTVRKCRAQLEAGTLVLVQRGRLRLRGLPVKRSRI
jgi:predicted nuclease of predicted toxin-antitoxin system